MNTTQIKRAAKYRKRPVVITATQWFKHGDHPAVMQMDEYDPVYLVGFIKTLEGKMRVVPGDWIITGVKGEHYPCKPDIFALTYEPAELQPAAAVAAGSEGGMLIDQIRRIAHEHGWAIGVHGSLVRDLDLIAVPWTEVACSSVDLWMHLRKGADLEPGHIDHSKPHGRVGYVMLQKGWKKLDPVNGKEVINPIPIDLSCVDPREYKATPKPAAAVAAQQDHRSLLIEAISCIRFGVNRPVGPIGDKVRDLITRMDAAIFSEATPKPAAEASDVAAQLEATGYICICCECRNQFGDLNKRAIVCDVCMFKKERDTLRAQVEAGDQEYQILAAQACSVLAQREELRAQVEALSDGYMMFGGGELKCSKELQTNARMAFVEYAKEINGLRQRIAKLEAVREVTLPNTKNDRCDVSEGGVMWCENGDLIEVTTVLDTLEKAGVKVRQG